MGKRKRSILLSVIALILVAAMYGCGGKDTQGILELSTEDGNIPWNFANTLKDVNYSDCLEQADELPQLKVGDKISLYFHKEIPAQIEVWDYVLDENGKEKKNDQTYTPQTITVENKRCTFTLPLNLADYTSSNSSGHSQEGSLRGFRIVYSSNEKEHNVFFVVRTAGA